MLESTASEQGTQVRRGDIVMIRTGWLEWYLSLDPSARRKVGTAKTMTCAGLEPTQTMAAWLWDHGVAAIACDNVALEVLPIDPGRGFLHHRLIPLLGMMIGELWNLGAFAADCAEDGRYEGLLVSAPLALPDGVGSPANVYVIK
jgi:kynurenine formamidase